MTKLQAGRQTDRQARTAGTLDVHAVGHHLWITEEECGKRWITEEGCGKRFEPGVKQSL